VHGPLAQGAFLLRLGAQARLDALIRARPEQAQALYEGASALIREDAMGERFKVIVLSAPGLPVPTGFEA
jgi:SAM-dependent MidA family methyltransferase